MYTKFSKKGEKWLFPGGSGSEEIAYNAGDPGLIPGLGRSPGIGNGNPLQYSCLENSMDKGAWQVTVHGVIESDMTEQLTLIFIKLGVARLSWTQFLRNFMAESQQQFLAFLKESDNNTHFIPMVPRQLDFATGSF